MDRVVQYRLCAAECLELAERAANPNDRGLLVSMAMRWIDLAEKLAESVENHTSPTLKRLNKSGGTDRIARIVTPHPARGLNSNVSLLAARRLKPFRAYEPGPVSIL